MLNGYLQRYSGREEDTYHLIHPSSRQFSVLTKQTSLVSSMIMGMMIGNLLAGIFTSTAPIGIFFILPLIIPLWIRVFKSYRVLGETYNNYLLPLEKSFNKMCPEDRRRYKRYLEDAYKTCSRNEEFDISQIKNTLELFNLTATGQAETKREKSAVELELEAVRAKIAAEQENRRLLDQALISEKKILQEIERKLNGH